MSGRRRRPPSRLRHRAALAGTTALLVLATLVAAPWLTGTDAAPAPPRAAGPPAAAALPARNVSLQHDGRPVPVFAYFYQWFTPASWRRAKIDLPLAGRYGSDDAHVLRDQVQVARQAGIDGFLTSWKHTESLDRRLDLLVRIAGSESLDLGVVYEALDFSRRPLPVATVQRDMGYLAQRWGDALRSRYYGRPVVIWTGIDQYSPTEVRRVRASLGDRVALLAASRSVAGYERVARLVDGEAYYWSSADPSSSFTTTKLAAMSQAVHAHHGIWLAPVASGFDGRTLGGSRTIGRDGGRTLVRSLGNAFATAPDGVAVISWNEWSENTYIEPGRRYGYQELTRLKSFLASHGKVVPPGLPGGGPTGASSGSGWTGAQAAVTLGLVLLATVPALVVVGRRRLRQPPLHRRPA